MLKRRNKFVDCIWGAALLVAIVSCSPSSASEHETVQPNWFKHHALSDHRMVKALGIDIYAVSKGKYITQDGQRVEVIGKGDELLDIYEDNGVIHLIVQ